LRKLEPINKQSPFRKLIVFFQINLPGVKTMSITNPVDTMTHLIASEYLLVKKHVFLA